MTPENFREIVIVSVLAVAALIALSVVAYMAVSFLASRSFTARLAALESLVEELDERTLRALKKNAGKARHEAPPEPATLAEKLALLRGAGAATPAATPDIEARRAAVRQRMAGMSVQPTSNGRS